MSADVRLFARGRVMSEAEFLFLPEKVTPPGLRGICVAVTGGLESGVERSGARHLS